VKTVNLHVPRALEHGRDRRRLLEVTHEVLSLSTGSPAGRPLDLSWLHQLDICG
jgi:hypothetical protein